MGFVFNLEKWIYENSNDVKDVITAMNLDINFSKYKICLGLSQE